MIQPFLLTVSFLFVLIGWSGCSEKNYFEPQEVKGSVQYDGELPAPIVEIGYEGATLADGEYITKEGGLQTYHLPEGYRFISQTEDRVVAAGDCKPNIVYNVKTHRSLEVALPRRLVAGLIIPGSDMLAFVIEGNSFGLYDLAAGKVVAKYDSDPATSADIRIANPKMLDQLVLMPTLDGKLVILKKDTGEKIREIIVGKGKEFNNIIYLNVIGDRLVAATPHRIISVSPKIMDAQSMEIADVIFVSDAIYILGKNGTIYHCDVDLKILNKKKFPFAHFVGAIYGEFIYAVEREGYIIATDPNLAVANVFELPDRIDRWFFTTPDAFYYDKYYFRLNTSTAAPTQEAASPAESDRDLSSGEGNATRHPAPSSTQAGGEEGEDSLSVEGLWHAFKGMFQPDESNDTIQSDE